MGKHRDLAILLSIVIIGMFIPFLGSLTLNYGLQPTKIVITFAHFLSIFGIELLIVYAYFILSSKLASKKLAEYNHKKH